MERDTLRQLLRDMLLSRALKTSRFPCAAADTGAVSGFALGGLVAHEPNSG
jgi:hypothetical protein